MLLLVKSFSYTLDASFSEEFHSWCYFYRGDIFTLLIGLERSFSYTPHASFSQEFLFPDASFSQEFYTPDVSFSEEFLLHSWCQF